MDVYNNFISSVSPFDLFIRYDNDSIYVNKSNQEDFVIQLSRFNYITIILHFFFSFTSTYFMRRVSFSTKKSIYCLLILIVERALIFSQRRNSKNHCVSYYCKQKLYEFLLILIHIHTEWKNDLNSFSNKILKFERLLCCFHLHHKKRILFGLKSLYRQIESFSKL